MITLVAILTCRHGSDGAGIEPGPARRVVREGQPAHEKLVGRLFVQRQGKDCNTPLCSRTSTHGSFLQKTRHTRPDCPQQGLDSETIVTVHRQSATYGAVCSRVKGRNERRRATCDSWPATRRLTQQG